VVLTTLVVVVAQLREEFWSVVPAASDKSLRDEWARVREGILECGRRQSSTQDGIQQLMNTITCDYDEGMCALTSFPHIKHC